ncbi:MULTISPECIES: glycosyltransferase family 2 protein [Actinosynnema]|uniref:glycosyltransferase family 2 protein n=1 Tax=Actinosynnema TaxID=40566 RepID=UPI0020A509E5|nr:glycosyltransferase family 2 protein [Actinosynnema pretiosum]MCP2097016.1 Glycosyltransferase involved in cell wall bisynthesis [Actinosynnema pretiosum]
MTLLVRDEIDVVAATIEHHLASGVDFVVATDNGSRDGTAEVLEAYRDAGVLELLHEPSLDYEQGRWVTRMARRAATGHGADWVVNADADEFFWPVAAARLDEALAGVPAEFGLVEVRRDNLVADPSLGSAGGWTRELVLRDTESLSTRGTRIGAKVCHRADPDVVVDVGNHHAAGPLLGARAPQRPLEILHVPDRGYAQYERKIANGGAAMAANTVYERGVGWHWREDYELLLDGRLAEAHAARQRTPEQARVGLAAGTLVPDTRLRDRLEALVARAVLPEALRAVLGPAVEATGTAGTDGAAEAARIAEAAPGSPWWKRWVTRRT